MTLPPVARQWVRRVLGWSLVRLAVGCLVLAVLLKFALLAGLVIWE